MKKIQTSNKPSGLITIRIVKAAAVVALAAFAVSSRAQNVPATRADAATQGAATPSTTVGPRDGLTPVAPQTSITTSALTDIRAETAWFLAVGQRGRNGPESFVVPVSDAARIAEVRQYLAERAAGTETRPLIPTLVLATLSDGINRNYSAPGTPLWPWRVTEVRGFTRYTRPEVEPAVFLPGRDSAPSEIENLLRGIVAPPETFALREYPIVMELQSGSARGALANVADRGFVGVGEQVKVTGFVVDGGTPRNVLIRVLGPTLAAFGVTGGLADPRFEVYRGSEKIAENDNWAAGNLNRPWVTVLAGTPPFSLIPNDSREPALELSLAPGAYTVVVTGVGNTTGIVLTEIYLQ